MLQRTWIFLSKYREIGVCLPKFKGAGGFWVSAHSSQSQAEKTPLIMKISTSFFGGSLQTAKQESMSVGGGRGRSWQVVAVLSASSCFVILLSTPPFQIGRKFAPPRGISTRRQAWQGQATPGPHQYKIAIRILVSGGCISPLRRLGSIHMFAMPRFCNMFRFWWSNL